MKKILLLLCFLAAAWGVTAQPTVLDQMKNELANYPRQDTARANKLLRFSYSSFIPRPEREKMMVEALAISRKKGYLPGEIYALTGLANYQLSAGNKAKSDSLLTEAEAFVKKHKAPQYEATLWFTKGYIYSILGKKEALAYLKRAEEAFSKYDPFQRLSSCQSSMVAHYSNYLSNYPAAMEYSLKALNTAEKTNAKEDIIQARLGMANLYLLMGDPEKALGYINEAEETIKKNNIGKTAFFSRVYNGKGEALRIMGRYKEAIVAYNLAIAAGSGFNSLAVNTSNLADVYTRMDSLSLAFRYGFGSLIPAKELDDPSLYGWIYGILARAYLKKSMPDSSLYYARAGLDSATVSGTLELMRDNALALANAYAYKKDFARAYPYHLKYISYRDSMLSTEVKNRTAVMEYNNNLNKKQMEIAQLSEQKKAQQNFLISALIILGMIAFGSVLLIRNIRQKQKANALLQKQKEEIDSKAKNVELLGEIGRKITSSLSVETIISTAYDNVNALMDASVFGIGIYDEASQTLQFPATYENGKALAAYSNAVSDANRFAALCFSNQQEYIIGNLEQEYKTYMPQRPNASGGRVPASLIYLPLKTKDKVLGVITVQSFKENAYSEYHLFMLRNVAIYTAIALENAESYTKLNQTIESLKQTQAQLIQKEKLASLGELTAGIAHEIQNPLNFVNNFSEVSVELLNEIKSPLTPDGGIRDGEKVDMELFEDIVVNLSKINLHGKRASSIVKGMLEHSRQSTGERVLTDLNQLADEYLRLSYHGMRAKDNGFNSDYDTDFDENLPKIEVIPQDIGRVLLNLLNNAFYAANQRFRPLQGDKVEGSAKVTISTKALDNVVEVKVTDNGTGMSEDIKSKIFQPFFTTKPTGEGTGLGLSLAYDIVTKGHGGTIECESVEGEGTTFTVKLPMI